MAQPLEKGLKMGLKVLIALAGMSPAVVTETLWALSHQGLSTGKRFAPDRLVLVTTGEGRKHLEQRLLARRGRSRSALQRLVDQEGLAADLALLGSGLDIRSVSTSDGIEQPDAHDPDGLIAMGDLIFEAIREFTEDDSNTVFVSLSGGRKTMGYLAGLSLSLLGRPQDRLLHVLVWPKAVESCPDFLFPEHGVDSYPVHSSNEVRASSVQASEVRIQLSQVPFVRMASLYGVRERVLSFASTGLAGVIAATNMTGEVPPMEIRLERNKGGIWLNDVDLAAMRDPKGGRLISSVACMTLLHFIGRDGGLGLSDFLVDETSPGGGSGHRLLLSMYRYWLALELRRNLPFKAEDWHRRLSSGWRPASLRAPTGFSAQFILDDRSFASHFVPREGCMRSEWDDLKVHLSKLRRAMQQALATHCANPDLYLLVKPGRENRFRLPPSLKLNED